MRSTATTASEVDPDDFAQDRVTQFCRYLMTRGHRDETTLRIPRIIVMRELAHEPNIRFVALVVDRAALQLRECRRAYSRTKDNKTSRQNAASDWSEGRSAVQPIAGAKAMRACPVARAFSRVGASIDGGGETSAAADRNRSFDMTLDERIQQLTHEPGLEIVVPDEVQDEASKSASQHCSIL